MRIATRVVLTLGFAVTAVMTVYGLISLHQRETLLSDAWARETATLARTLQIVVDNALRDRRFGDLDVVLARVAADPETWVSVVLHHDGRVLAGGPAPAIDCLARHGLDLDRLGGEVQGWADCAERVRWVTLPTRPPAAAVVLARSDRVVARDVSLSRRRILATILALTATAALVVLLVLRRTLSAPLAEVMRGVRRLGGPDPPSPIAVSNSAGELRDLARAFNEMTERLGAKRRTLVREVEERLSLERRLRQAEKFAALGRFTSGLAHELGSPLNVIQVRAEAILADGSASSTARRQAEEIVAEIERVAELVRDLTHVARRHGIEHEAVDLVQVARAAVAGVRASAEAADVQVDMDVSTDPVFVRGEATLLRHALFNLMVNAVQALDGCAGKRRLCIRIDESGQRARAIVEDNGPGIAPEHARHVFEPFFTTKDVGEGTGLGLAIGIGIVEEHGGNLTLEPREGGGVRATITLPAIQRPVKEGV